MNGETGEFKALVWTLTALPGVDRVAVRVQGRQLQTLPGGIWNLMNRYAARIFSGLALGASLLGTTLTVRSAPTVSYTFQDRRIDFSTIVQQSGGRAVAMDDPGLRALLGALAATIAWQPNQRYILVTTAQPEVISFALGDRRYDEGPVTQSAPFAPFLLDGRAFVPFDELLHALGLAVKAQGTQQILQPQITSLDLQNSGGAFELVAHGALPLDGRILSQGADKIVIAFGEVGSTLPPSRTYEGDAVRRVEVRSSGSALHPRTIITVYTGADAGDAVPGTDDQRDFTLAFGGAMASAPPSPGQAPSGVHVTGVQTQNENGRTTIRIAVDGASTYEWHRLRPPDNRVWIDVHNARLATAPADSPVRVHQQSPDTVRVAVSLAQYQTVQVVPDAQGLTVTIGPELADESAPRSGSGSIGAGAVAVAPTPAGSPQNWKFAPAPSPGSTYVPSNPRLIVIDPGHGGDDPGTVRGNVAEKNLTLEMSKRLRDILVARGWQVVMTRTGDYDVGVAGDTDAHMLQARDDIANSQGARLFISIHVNAFINSGPHGATVYYYKTEDYAFAQALERRIAAQVAVKDDGIVKDNSTSSITPTCRRRL